MGTSGETAVPVCRLTKRPLGRILVDGAFISEDLLEEALREQLRTNELLGNVLVRMGVLDRTDLGAALSVQSELASFEKAVRTAAGVRQMLGRLLMQARRITREQLDLALEEQRRTGDKLGEILLRRGLLTPRELDALLVFQQSQGSGNPYVASFKLGEIMVAANYISRDQLRDALEKQRVSQQKLGEVLIQSGYVQPHHVEHGLKLQNMLLTAALVAMLSLAAMPEVHAAERSAGSPGSGRVMVTASVVPRATLKIVHQASELVVTQADILHGFVEVRSASRIEIKNNSRAGYLVTFDGLCIPFREVYVNGLGSEVRVSLNGGGSPMQYTKEMAAMELSYRFILAENTLAGTYTWPLAISAQPL